jgi:pyruvate dehydrogenase E2 component (dihydrolipoamide acetyltransferase)
MPVEIVLPRLGWTMEEGIFGEWLQEEGNEIKEGDLLFTVETDKATQEIEAFASGFLRIAPNAPKPCDVVPVGSVLGYLVSAGEAPPFEGQSTVPSAIPISPAAVTEPAHATSATAQHVAPAPPPVRARALPTISPRARRVATELDVDWAQLQGSGRTGRIVERDVRAAATAQASAKVRATPVAQRMAQAEGVDLTALAQQKAGRRIQREDVAAVVAARDERTQPTTADATGAMASTHAPAASEAMPVTRIRRLIAQRMAESSQTTAAVTLTTEADATELVALREQFKAALSTRGQSAPSYNDLLIKLTATALQEHRTLNSTWNEDEILLHEQIHIGLAVETDAGLLVPVVRDAQAKSLRQISGETARLIEGAQAQRLSVDLLQGGTFTITNLGMYGIDAFTPIIQLPQCAILGVGRIVAKPAVINDQVLPRRMMALSLTFDHRVIDGGPAARFLNTLREFIETPTLWLGT